MSILIPIIIAVAALAVGGTVAVSLNWDKVVIALKGKKLAVLGEREVGKTVLIKYLTTGTVKEEYEQTIGKTKTDANRFNLKDLSLSIKKSYDVPGSKDDYIAWRSVTKEADIVLYLLRIDKLMKGDETTEKRVRRDMEHISRWLEENPKEYPIFLIGTYCDSTEPDFTKLPENKIGDYQDRVRELSIFKTIELLLVKSGNEKRVKLGSLKSKKDTERLVRDLLREIIE